MCLGVDHCSTALSDLCNIGIPSMAPDIYLAFNNGNYCQYSKNNQRCLQTGLRDTRFPWWLSGKASACNAGEGFDPWEGGKPGMLQSMGLQRVERDLATEQQYED